MTPVRDAAECWPSDDRLLEGEVLGDPSSSESRRERHEGDRARQIAPGTLWCSGQRFGGRSRLLPWMVVEWQGAAPVPKNGGDGRATGADALEMVFRESGAELVGLARLLVDDPGEAEEVVQEAFVATLSAWPRVRRREDPLKYVRSAVINKARGRLRRRRSARRWRPEPMAHARSAEAIVVDASRWNEVTRAVVALPRRQRESVALRYYADCTVPEIADLLRVSAGAVKQHLHRGLAALERDLSGRDL